MDEKDKELQELRRENEKLKMTIEQYKKLLAEVINGEAEQLEEGQAKPWDE